MYFVFSPPTLALESPSYPVARPKASYFKTYILRTFLYSPELNRLYNLSTHKHNFEHQYNALIVL